MRFIRSKLESARNFANKLWNASRFTIMNLQDDQGNFLPMSGDSNSIYKDEDRWMTSVINDAIKEVTELLDRFELGLAGQKVYDLIWNEYCDWYIELIKCRLYGYDEEDKKAARFSLQSSLKTLLKLLHPFMPFITEEIWGYLPGNVGRDGEEPMLIKAGWPEFNPNCRFDDSVSRIETAKEIIKAVRNVRAEAGAAPGRTLNIIIVTDTIGEIVMTVKKYIKSIANVNDIRVMSNRDGTPEDAMTSVIEGGEILVPLEELMDIGAEIERLNSERRRLENEVNRVERKLSNEKFISKAPSEIVQEERDKGEKYREMLTAVVERIDLLRAKAR